MNTCRVPSASCRRLVRNAGEARKNSGMSSFTSGALLLTDSQAPPTEPNRRSAVSKRPFCSLQ